MTRAFTLIEMVVSLTVMSIVFLAMGSVMMLATRAAPDPGAPVNLALDAADTLEQFTSELQVANSLTAVTERSITFTVPDRDDDGNDEALAYSWSGVAGDPLVRIYNGGASVQVLPSVHEFTLTPDITQAPQPDAPVQSAEVELTSHLGLLSFNDYPVKDKNWIGQYFAPMGLPAEAVGWSVTRVLFEAKTHGGNKGETFVQLRPALAGGIPDSTVLEQTTMFESALGSGYTWQEFSFSSVRDRAPGDGLCLVLQWVSDADSADIRFDSVGGSGMLVTADSGTSWSNRTLQAMNYYVYGTYTTVEPQPPIDVMRSVTITLNTGQDAGSRVRTAVVSLNQPPMP